MTGLLIDTSVLVKWFHVRGEGEVEASRAVRAAHVAGEVDAHILELGLYELGNVLIRALKWQADDVADQLDDLATIFSTPLVLTAEWYRDAANLAVDHQLTFYDAAWAAAARGLGVPLVSADRKLLESGLAESPTDIATRLRLRMP